MKDTSRLKVVRAWRCGNPDDNRAGWCVEFRYDKAGVERLKRLIPPAERKWDDSAKVWWISDDYLPEAQRVAPALETITAQEKLL
jgi:hypothetical protein